MNILRIVNLAVVGALLAWGTSSAEAQRFRIQLGNSGHHDNHHDDHHSGHHGSHHNGWQQVTPGVHIDHHDHVIRNSRGRVTGNYHHDVIHSNSTYIVPHTGSHHHGTYHHHNGKYYYTPRTVVVAGRPVISSQPTVVAFGSFSNVDDLAERLETLSNNLCLDMHYNYSHNPGFQKTYGEAYQLKQISQFIHADEHRHDRAAIQNKLSGLDQLFHHVQEDVRGWSRHQHKQIGQLGILSKMELIESTLHHLMNDVGVRPTPAGGVQQAPAPGTTPGGVEQAPVPTLATPIKL